MSPRYARADAAGHRVADHPRRGPAPQHPATGRTTAAPRPAGDGGPERRDSERHGPGRQGSGRRAPGWLRSEWHGPERRGPGRQGSGRCGPVWSASLRRGPQDGTGEAR